MNKFFIMGANKCLDLIKNDTIKMIYIDPPYNTKSNNFEYCDNNEKWNKMMENLLDSARLKLKEEGVIFISIDDNKMFDLKKVCDNIFNVSNFLGLFITKQATRSNSKHINIIHEYILCYSKNKVKTPKFMVYRKDMEIYKDTINRLIKTVKKKIEKQGNADLFLKEEIKKISQSPTFSWIKNYNSIDEKGNIYFAKDLSVPTKPHELNIEEINLYLPKLKTRGWSSKEKIIKLYYENKLVFKNNRPYEKQLLIESKDNVMSLLNFYSRQGKHDLEKLGLEEVFKTAKPVNLVKYLIQFATKDNDIILDFFAGSGTTAQAVIELNKEEKTHRKFYICNKNEKIKNNEKVLKLLKFYNLGSTIPELIKLRLLKLKEKYEFEYEIIKK